MFKGLHIKEPECENCPLSWEVRYEAGDGDCGCMVYNDLFQNGVVCHFPSRIKYAIAKYKEKKNAEAEAHAYDGIGEWYEEEQRKDKAFREAIEKEIFHNQWGEEFYLCFKGKNGQYYKYDLDWEPFERARMRYEELLWEAEDGKT